MNDNDANTTDLSSKNTSTTIESIRSRLLWNDLFYRIRVKGDHKPRRRCVSEFLYPELTVGQYETLLDELIDLEKAHPDLDQTSQTYHPLAGFLCGLGDSDSPVDQNYLSDFTEFLLDPTDNPSDADKWLMGLIFDFRYADQSHFKSILENKWTDFVMDTRPGWWVDLGKEKQNVVLVELYFRQNTTGKTRRPKYAIGVETLLDDGALDGYQDESEKLKARYAGTDAEVYLAFLKFRRTDKGTTASERIFKRLA